jgi:hypothetical protein
MTGNRSALTTLVTGGLHNELSNDGFERSRLPLPYAIFWRTNKVKQSSLQAWTGFEGSRRLRLPDFKTVGTGKW